MYGYGLPSPTSSSGQAVTPPGHSRFLPSQGVPTPGAPFMFSRDLPPSPQTPSTSLPHGRETAPFTPLMGYVPLPTMPGPYGLMTPPASPTKSRGTGNVHPCLTQAGASGVLFHLGRPIQNIRFQSNQDPRLVFSQPATDINATALHILLPFGIEITITNPSGIQVGDVFHQLQVELSKRPTAQELSTFASVMRGTSLPSTAVRRADLIATSPYFAGLTPYGNSWRLQIRQA